MNAGRVLRRLLRLALRRATGGGTRRSGYGQDRSGEDAPARAAQMAARCRRALGEARARRKTLIADLLRYGEARDILMTREAAEPAGPEKDALRRSLETLDKRLVAWFDELDALDARIAGLESELAFLTGMAGESGGNSARDEARSETTAEASIDAERARHLAALGLGAMPATLAELKAAYRTRLKAVHPDVGAQASTDDAAAATVAFAELRKHFVRS